MVANNTRKNITNLGGGSILDTINKGTPDKITPGMGDYNTQPLPNNNLHINDYLGKDEIRLVYDTGNGVKQVLPKPGIQNEPIPYTPKPINTSKIPGAAGTAITTTYVKEPVSVIDDGTGSPSTSTKENLPSKSPTQEEVLPPKPTIDDYKKYEPGNTGSGINSALGTQYSWNKKGTDQANLQYQQDTLAAKQEALANRQTIEQNSLQYQQQVDMMKYTANQEAEKVGWTGGYVLDQNRQMEYLKASIQAQMYGAMELQKYGYESALAAARLSYDLNQMQFAHQYYMDAVSVAMQEANQTGQYISAEIKDMMSQYGVASEILNSKDATEEEKERATQIQTTIDNWFATNGLSKTGVQTLAAYNADREFWLQQETLKWKQYMDEITLKQGALDSLNNTINSNANAFEMLDDEGNRIYDESTGTYKSNDWTKMDGTDIIDYIHNDDGTINNTKLQQFYSYIDTQLTGQVSSGFASYIKAKTDAGETIDPLEYPAQMLEYLNSSDALSNFLTNKFSSLNDEQAKQLFENLNGYSIDVAMPDGTYYTYNLKVETKTTTTFNPEGVPENNGDKKPTNTGVWKSYEEAAAAGFSNIRTQHEFSRNNNEDKQKYGTYDKYLEAMYKKYITGTGDGNIDTIILDKNYEDGEKAAINLIKSESFQELMTILEGMNLTDSPEKWIHDPDHIGAQWLTWFPYIDRVGTTGYKDLYNDMKSTKDKIVKGIGETNYNLILDYAKKYATMTEREKAALSTTEIERYEQLNTFATKMYQLDTLIDYYRQNDANPLTNPWEHIGNEWENWWDKWTHTDNLSDVVTNVLDTAGTIVSTAGDTVIGILQWVTGNWFQGW